MNSASVIAGFSLRSVLARSRLRAAPRRARLAAPDWPRWKINARWEKKVQRRGFREFRRAETRTRARCVTLTRPESLREALSMFRVVLVCWLGV